MKTKEIFIVASPTNSAVIVSNFNRQEPTISEVLEKRNCFSDTLIPCLKDDLLKHYSDVKKITIIGGSKVYVDGLKRKLEKEIDIPVVLS